MGNWSEQQTLQKERKEKDRVRRDKLAGYFFDLSKLSFAGFVIGIVLPLFSDTQNSTMWLAAMFGIVLTCLIHRNSYYESKLPAPLRSARSSSLKVGFTTFCIVIAVLSLMHRHLGFSLRNPMN